MPLKVIFITATALGLVGDTNIANMDLQVVMIGQLQQIVNQLTSNGQALKNKITKMGNVFHRRVAHIGESPTSFLTKTH